MVKIVRMAVVLMVLVVAYNEVLPWLQEGLGSTLPQEADTGPARCVGLADQANDSFGERVGRVSGPGADPGAWASFKAEIQDKISAAQRECRCPKPSCGIASNAMIELEDLLDQLDIRFRGGSMDRNPVQKQIGISERLNEARKLVREGS